MSWNTPPLNSGGANGWRCLQLVGGSDVFGCFGNSISTTNVAFASLRTGLEVDMVNRLCASAVVRPSNRRGDPGNGQSLPNGNCYISYRYSLGLCSRKLREEAW